MVTFIPKMASTATCYDHAYYKSLVCSELRASGIGYRSRSGSATDVVRSNPTGRLWMEWNRGKCQATPNSGTPFPA